MKTKTTKPVMTKRARDLGWIASTPPEYPLRFAVTGRTEEEARLRFFDAVVRWESLGAPESEQRGNA